MATARCQEVSREDASDGVREGLVSIPRKAGKQGYGRSPELPSTSDTILFSTLRVPSHLERPEHLLF